jgi:hypothetical protein
MRNYQLNEKKEVGGAVGRVRAARKTAEKRKVREGLL